MTRTAVHRGAIPERLAEGPDDQCSALMPGVKLGDNLIGALRCVYYEGHEGPHYCRGEIWGNARSEP